MKITELQKTYPHIKFYELTSGSNKAFLSMKKLEDFLDIVKIVGYIEIEVSGEEASEIALESVIQSYCSEKKLYNSRYRDEFVEFVEDNLTKKLEKLTTCREYTFLELYGLDFNVMYTEDHFMSQVDYNSAKEELNHIYETFQAKLVEQKKKFDENVKACILGYKDEYNQARNETAKKEIVKKVQLDLKLKYGLDAHSDYRATAICIKRFLEIGLM